MGREHRAQIGIFENDKSMQPVVIIDRNENGPPTGHGGVTTELLELVPAIVQRRGVYDAEQLAAQLVQALVSQASHDYQYGLSRALSDQSRFFYAVRPSHVEVFDARNMASIEDLRDAEPMFVTAWVDPASMLALEKRRRELEDELSVVNLNLEGAKRKQFKTKH